jgi:hypothetical protein
MVQHDEIVDAPLYGLGEVVVGAYMSANRVLPPSAGTSTE